MTAQQRFETRTPQPDSLPQEIARPSLGACLYAAWIRVRTRRALAHLTMAEMADAGITRSDALQELSVPLWKIFRDALRQR